MSKSDWMCKQCSDFCRESERRKHKVKKTLRRHLVWVTQVFLSSGRLLKMLFFFFQLLRWEEPRWWVNWEHLAVRLPLAPCCFFKSTSLFCVSHQQAPHIHKHTLLWRVTRYVCHQVVVKKKQLCRTHVEKSERTFWRNVGLFHLIWTKSVDVVLLSHTESVEWCKSTCRWRYRNNTTWSQAHSKWHPKLVS